jgi:tRNA G10  N-methylase Trm11
LEWDSVNDMQTSHWPAGLPTVLRLEKANRTALPEAFADDDVRFSEGLVAEMVERLTRPGDVVLDPFAGFGTTLAVAAELGREGWGVELDPDRAAHVRSRLAEPQRLIEGDAHDLPGLAIPPVSLVLCSPPYSTPGQASAALTAYREPNPGYQTYLDGLRGVFRNVAKLLRPGGWVVIEVSNLRTDRGLTLLA